MKRYAVRGFVRKPNYEGGLLRRVHIIVSFYILRVSIVAKLIL